MEQMPIIIAQGRLRQKEQELKVSLGYTVRPRSELRA